MHGRSRTLPSARANRFPGVQDSLRIEHGLCAAHENLLAGPHHLCHLALFERADPMLSGNGDLRSFDAPPRSPERHGCLEDFVERTRCGDFPGGARERAQVRSRNVLEADDVVRGARRSKWTSVGTRRTSLVFACDALANTLRSRIRLVGSAYRFPPLGV